MKKYRKVYVIDDNSDARKQICTSLISADFEVRPLNNNDFKDCAASLAPGCAVVEVFPQGVPYFPALEIALSQRKALLAIAMCDDCSIAVAVKALKLGAVDIYDKHLPIEELIEKLENVISDLPEIIEKQTATDANVNRCLSLTRRQFQVLKLVCDGKLSKHIAYLLDISIRTVEMHREEIPKHLGQKRLFECVQIFQSVRDEKQIVDRCNLEFKSPL